MVKATRSSAAKRTTNRSAAAKTDAAAPATVRKRAAPKATASRSTTTRSAAAKGASAKRAAPAKSPARTRAAAARPTKTAAKAAPKTAAVAKGATAAAAQCAPVELGYLSGFVGFHLRLAQDASYRAFARFTDKELVKPGRFPALAIIHLNPGISQSALGRAIARDKSTVSPLIKDLQKNGYISRKPSPSDRRSVTLALTKKGERVLDRLHARALEHEGDLDKILGTAKGRLVSVLDKITGGLAAS